MTSPRAVVDRILRPLVAERPAVPNGEIVGLVVVVVVVVAKKNAADDAIRARGGLSPRDRAILRAHECGRTTGHRRGSADGTTILRWRFARWISIMATRR